MSHLLVGVMECVTTSNVDAVMRYRLRLPAETTVTCCVQFRYLLCVMLLPPAVLLIAKTAVDGSLWSCRANLPVMRSC